MSTTSDTIHRRYRITGNLILKTALHIGGGGGPARGTDSPVLRDGYDRPYIPGSSLKGALRAAVERILANLDGHTACRLFVPLDPDEKASDTKNGVCLTPLPEQHEKKSNYRLLEQSLGVKIESNDDVQQALQTLLRGWEKKVDPSHRLSEQHLLMVLEENLCDVCKAFGSPFMASSIYFHDAPVIEERWIGLTQVRDGVGIDRDSGRAKAQIKYDYEIVPPGTAFEFSMTIESGNDQTIGLAALALHELMQGNVPLGGIRSRGLGRCLLEDVSVKYIDFSDLKAYLLEGTWKTQSVEEFKSYYLNALLSGEA